MVESIENELRKRSNLWKSKKDFTVDDTEEHFTFRFNLFLLCTVTSIVVEQTTETEGKVLKERNKGNYKK